MAALAFGPLLDNTGSARHVFTHRTLFLLLVAYMVSCENLLVVMNNGDFICTVGPQERTDTGQMPTLKEPSFLPY